MNESDPSDAYTRRGFLSVSGALAASTALLAEAQPSRAQESSERQRDQTAIAPGATANPPVEVMARVLWDLVAANRILAHFNLIDGLGHVSVRNPSNPNSYLMASAEILPAAGEVNLDNLGEFDFDNRPMDTKGRRSWPERFIFGATYRARPDVQAILHCHPPAIVLQSCIGELTRPIYHMPGFIGEGIPVFDLSKAVGHDTGITVGTLEHGRLLAQVLGDKPAVFMRGHGCAVVGNSLAQAVGRTVYLNIDCDLQYKAQVLQALGKNVQYLTPGEARLRDKNDYLSDWDLWKHEVMARDPSLYSIVG